MQHGRSVIWAVWIALVALAPACSSILGLHDVTGPSCSDHLRNGDETDEDCGGSCGPCATGRSCGVAGDCMSSVCDASQCAAPRCDDQVANGDESDADCGGSCKPCGDGQACLAAIDCTSAVCTSSVCQAPSCDDRARNGDETDADCGGSCKPCGDGEVCTAVKDCLSAVCTENVCQAATCDDRVQNGDESDRDCGGTACAGCVVGLACHTSSDCAGSEVCDAALCREAKSCLDVLQHRPGSASGVYRIMPVAGEPFDALCDMDTSHDGGGWTLLLKSSGDATLAYNAAYWTDGNLLRAEDLTTNPGNAKYDSFCALPVTMLVGELDGFRYSFTPPCVGCENSARTAQRLFLETTRQDGVVLGHPAMGSGASWSTQPHCQWFGINTPFGYSHARFGWTANQEDDCETNDTAIGLGLINEIPPTPGITDLLGAGYLCVSSDCSSGIVRTPGTGLLWGR